MDGRNSVIVTNDAVINNINNDEVMKRNQEALVLDDKIPRKKFKSKVVKRKEAAKNAKKKEVSKKKTIAKNVKKKMFLKVFTRTTYTRTSYKRTTYTSSTFVYIDYAKCILVPDKFGDFFVTEDLDDISWTQERIQANAQMSGDSQERIDSQERFTSIERFAPQA